MQVKRARGKRKVSVGTVVSTGMDKTAVVAIKRSFAHSMYGKVVHRTRKVAVHDEDNSCAVGDVVRIAETRPLSKTKRWRYLETVRKSRLA